MAPVAHLEDRDPRLWWAAYLATCTRCLHTWGAVLPRPAGQPAPAVVRGVECPACRGPFGQAEVG
jgi:hypothetical protein